MDIVRLLMAIVCCVDWAVCQLPSTVFMDIVHLMMEIVHYIDSCCQVIDGNYCLQGRAHIFKIHARSMSVEKDIRYELLARLCPNSTGELLGIVLLS